MEYTVGIPVPIPRIARGLGSEIRGAVRRLGLLPTRPGHRVFLSWWKYTSRPDSFARQLGAKNFFFAQGEKWGLLKYVPRAWHCFAALVRERPSLVFVSNPPTLAPLVAWFYCLLFRARYCIDTHTSAFDRVRWQRLMWLTIWLSKRAIWVATTNRELTTRLTDRGVNGVVVEDIPFEMTESSYPVSKTRFTVAAVCSFDADEPIQEIVDAARMLPEVDFFLTGNPKKAPKAVLDNKPDNVTFTGFLSNQDYAGLLRSVKSILVLTTNDFTMQRGGSEAITVKRPLITSDFPVLRRIFYKGTIHVDNSPKQIADAVTELHNHYDRYRNEIAEMYDERNQRWDALHQHLETQLPSV